MPRFKLNSALKQAILAKDTSTITTVRLILAALKERDIRARTNGDHDEISDNQIIDLLQSMVKQRRESIVMYKKGNRSDLVKQEETEITVIEKFLPKPLSDHEIEDAVQRVINKIQATSLKDMGKTMAILRTQYRGSMNFSKASNFVKKMLS